MLDTRSSKDSRKDELFEGLFQSIERQFSGSHGSTVPSLSEWAESTPIMLDGRPFTFHRHEYLIEPYQDDHPFQVEMKAAQLGLTSRAMLKAVYKARYGQYRGILYLFPSKTDVTDFSKGRVDPLIDENPQTTGRWVHDTDSANIKRIWNCYLLS
jgi:hypothetical protein